MKKNLLSMLLILALCLGMLAGCGGESEAADSASQATEASSTEETSQVQEEAPAEVSEAEESVPAAAEETVRNTISYPIEGGHTFTIVNNPNGLVSSVMGDDGYEMSSAHAALEEATGVNLEWTLYSEATWNEQFNLLMASNDWPDLFNCGVASRYNGGVTALLEDDVVIELSEYLEEYAPDYKALLDSNVDFADCLYQQDGTIVEFAAANSSVQDKGMMIRQDWLDELGLEAPATVDELTEVLLAFKNEYDLGMSLLVLSGLDTGLTYAYNVDSRGFSNGGLGWVVEDDEVKVTFDTDGFRGYLELLTSYYEQGIFNDDYVNISYELGNVDSTYLDGKCGVFFVSVSALSESQKANASDPDFQLTALPDIKLNADDPESGVTEVTYTGINSLVISTQCEAVEEAIMFCNYFYTEEGQYLANWGVEGEAYTIGDNGKPQYTETVLNDAECFMYMITQTKYALGWAPTIVDSGITTSSFDDNQLAAVDMWTAQRGSYLLIPKNATSTTEEQEIETLYGSDVSTYIWENVYKIVTGQQSLDTYDSVMETAYGMGLTELTEASQARYDRYMANNA